MKKVIPFCLTLVLICLFALPCSAIDNTGVPWIYRPFKKLGRGVTNLVTSPLEIPNQMYVVSRKEYDESAQTWAVVGGYIAGFFSGFGYAGWRMAAGAYDTITFPFPSYEYSLIEPEFISTEMATRVEKKEVKKGEKGEEKKEQTTPQSK
jgi:putative exosortase-associated protein (TIGR04073 family)